MVEYGHKANQEETTIKSLQTIQKTFRVFQILSKIAMILSFIWAGMAALGLLCAMVWLNGGTVFGADQELIYRMTATGSMTVTGSLTEMIGVLLVDMILALTDGTLLAFALRYFKAEQADGTPFTLRGAEQVLHLGIRTIVLPLVAAIVCAVICELMGVPQNAVRDWGNLNSLTTGLVLILTSVIFRYGAELEQKNSLQAPQE